MRQVWAYVGAAAMGLVVAGGAMTAAAPQTGAPKAAPAKSTAGAGRVIALTGDDTMKYNQPTITAKKGETVTLELTNKGTLPKEAMAHNFVLLTKGTNADEFTMAAAMARATEYIPANMKDKIIAHTSLAGPGETVKVTFKVPAVAGSYTFLCSFAGHAAAGMKGTLVVQ
jgi:azurin